MTANVPNRKTLRKALGTLLSTALVGTGLPVDAVYSYRASTFKKNVVVCVSSSDADRTKQAQPTRAMSYLYFDIDLFVVYAVDNFSEEHSEDKLDDVEKAVSDVLLDNDTTANWDEMLFDGPSDYQIVPIGGRTYRRETITVRMQVFSE